MRRLIRPDDCATDMSLLVVPSPARRRAMQQIAAFGAVAGGTLLAGVAGSAHAGTRRLLSIGGGLTEIVYALQAERELVGVDTTSLYPPAAQKLPSVGYARTLSLEGMLALSPTHVIATEDAGPSAVLRQLADSKIEVQVLAANHKFEGLLARIERIGQLTARQTQAEQLRQNLQQQWRALQQRLAQKNGAPVRVLFVLTHIPGQTLVGGRDSSIAAMLEYAGAANVFGTPNSFSGYKQLTPESVVAAQPDVILVTEQSLRASGGVDGILKVPGLAQTPAGRKRRVIAMESIFLLGFGPRLPGAVAHLEAAIAKAMQTT